MRQHCTRPDDSPAKISHSDHVNGYEFISKMLPFTVTTFSFKTSLTQNGLDNFPPMASNMRSCPSCSEIKS